MRNANRVYDISLYRTGWCGLEYVFEWRAYATDKYGYEGQIAGYGKTKKECIADARRNGYVVPHYVI